MVSVVAVTEIVTTHGTYGSIDFRTSYSLRKGGRGKSMTKPLKFALFEKASPSGQDLVSLWHERAKDAGDGQRHDSFDTFMRLWCGFNNWAMRVTEADADADMIRALAESLALNKAFARLFEENNEFRTCAIIFAKFWPIFNVKDLRKKKLTYVFQQLDRATYVKKLLAAHVQHAPRGKFDGDKPTWDATIRAIYQARCNLAHGEKGDSSDDYRIIEGAYRTLLCFIDGVALYRWRNAESAQSWPVVAK